MAKTSVHVDNILRPKSKDLGTVEGYLETISIHGTPQIRLFHSLTRDEIRCYIDDELLDSAWKLMRSGMRVAVTGEISYQNTGRPTSIKVQKLRAVDSSQALPAKRILGLFSRVGYATE